jgi:YVTN family beta-propeller protein
MMKRALLAGSLSVVLAAGSLPANAAARPDATVGGNLSGSLLPIGEYITPLVTPGSSFQRLSTGLRADGTADANGGISTALSPDGKTLLVLTSGYNAGFFTPNGTAITTPFLYPLTGRPATCKTCTTGTFQWVFVYDVSGTSPMRKQQIALTSSFAGITWDPKGTRFYVSGGQDDRVYIYKQGANGFAPDAPFVILNHSSHGTNPVPSYDNGGQVTGVSISPDGKSLFAANVDNNSVSVADASTRKVVREFTLPGAADFGGQYPIWVTPHAGLNGATDKLYVSSLREGKIVIFTASGALKSIVVGGEPEKSLLSRDGSRLYVVNPNLDQIDQIDTASDTLTRVIDVRRPGYRYHGSNPNSLALSADGKTLYVTIAGENAIGVIDVASGTVLGRIPTAWYPSSVTISADGSKLYVSNMKANAGPTPFNNTPAAVAALNTTNRDDYVLAREKGGLETFPIPDASTLAYLSAVVDSNNRFTANRQVSPTMQFLRTKIKHVIFIQKENRTYDQVLGDLPVGNGDPRLALFPQAITPNNHSLAMQFADLDNFYNAGDVSNDGWNWDYEGYANDIDHQATPVSYAGDGNVASPIFGGITVSGPIGVSDVYGVHTIQDNAGTSDLRPDTTGGYLWDSALRAGLSIRHYGQYLSGNAPIVRHANRVNKIQGFPLFKTLAGHTNQFFYQWDTRVPDEFRYEVWKDEFDSYVKYGNMPNFEFMQMNMDHTGNLGVNGGNVANLETPEQDVASNDHAIGQLVDAVSHSPYWASTAIFIEEDDAQDGPDHVDGHRSAGFIISPYTAHNKVVHTFYNTVNMDRTMEDLLGMDHLGLNDANAVSMDDVFAYQPDLQPYNVLIPGNLCAPPVDTTLVPDCFNPQMRSRVTRAIRSLRGAKWWSVHSKRFAFNKPDANDPAEFNHLLWQGMVGDNVAYPDERSGLDLSQDRAVFLKTAYSPVSATR